MLKKILIGVAVVLILAVAVTGFAAYHLYSNVLTITGHKSPRLVCPVQKPYYGFQPMLLPWTSSSSTAASTFKPSPTAIPSTTPRTTPVATGTKAPCEPAAPNVSLSSKKRINILVLGSDNDSKMSSLLSQTIMVVTIDPVHKTVGMLSIPRDSWVYVPGVGGYAKIDEAMSDGEQASASNNPEAKFLNGVRYARATVEDNFGITIDYYAWVGLTGFEKVINTLNGVCLNAMHPIVDDNYPGDLSGGNAYSYTRVYIPAGPQCMKGATALQYVRSRHADLIGDYGRGARQEQMLLAIRHKIDELGLTDIFTINNLVSDLTGYVQSDVGSQVFAMANFARGVKLSQIHRVVLTPPHYSTTGMSPDGTQDVVYLNLARVEPLIKKMFAPIARHKGTSHHHPPRTVTATQALALLTRTSGAVPARPPHSPPPKQAAQPVSGHLYFVSNGNVWALTSSGAHQVTHTSAIDGAYTTPNNHKLVYYRKWSAVVSDVWLQNLQTGQSTQITHDHSTDGYVQDNLWAVNPIISPDGKTIVYASDAYKLTTPTLTTNPDCATSPANGGIDLALYSYSVETGTTTQITAPCWGAGGDTDPRFDPSNPNRLVYTEYYYLPNSSIASRLVVLNLATDTSETITPYAGRAMQAAWSPSGNHMVWLGSSDQSTTLYEAAYYNGSLHTKTTRQIDAGLISEPTFSPDGKHLAYFKLIGNDFQLYEVNLKNGWPVGQPAPLLSKSGMVASSPLVWTK